MEMTMHDVVAIVFGKVNTLTNTQQRELTITNRKGERIVITLFADDKKELQIVKTNAEFPSHSLPSRPQDIPGKYI